MDQLIPLRMQEHELTMRQMVTEIHRGTLNITQAAAKFEVNRTTVKHWLDKVEQEAETAKPQVVSESIPPPLKKKLLSRQEADQVAELKVRLQSLEAELEAAKFKSLYYATLIQVAEQELGVDIEKKSVTKPSASY